jgi:hypothetical protein
MTSCIFISCIFDNKFFFSKLYFVFAIYPDGLTPSTLFLFLKIKKKQNNIFRSVSKSSKIFYYFAKIN